MLAVLDDLIFSVRIEDAARRAGLSYRTAVSMATIEEALAGLPAIVIIDLNLKLLDVAAAIRLIRSACPATPLVAYYPHVQAELKQLAIEAGAERVMARSAFVADLEVMLERAAATAGLDQ